MPKTRTPYAINAFKEQTFPVTEVPDHAPKKRGRKIAVSTGYRWRNGVRGVKLPTLMVGGVEHTSEGAMQWFFEAVTAAKNGETVDTQDGRTYAERERAMKQAEARLEMAGA